jgi:hypothetical protein
MLKIISLRNRIRASPIFAGEGRLVMKALVLDAQWDPKPGYVVSEFEKRTGKAISGNSIWRHPKLEIKGIDTPKIGPDEVLIKVRACAICTFMKRIPMATSFTRVSPSSRLPWVMNSQGRLSKWGRTWRT